MMTPREMEHVLESIVIIVDTKEHVTTEAFKKRVKNLGYPYYRKHLDFGDYNVNCSQVSRHKKAQFF